MVVELIIDVEFTDDGTVCWSAVTPRLSGFVAAAEDLKSLRRQAAEALQDELGAPIELHERMSALEPGSALESDLQTMIPV